VECAAAVVRLFLASAYFSIVAWRHSPNVPPMDIKAAALNNQNRRWKERLDMRNRPAQQRFFSFLPLGRLGFIGFYLGHPK